MKKLISMLITLSLIGGSSTVTFAAGNSTTTTSNAASTQAANLTPQQQQARDAFLKVYFDDMNQLVALRQQTQTAVDANNGVAKQIKDKLKAKITISSDTITQLKDLVSQRKILIDQAKQFQTQRISLRSQYEDAITAKDITKMKSIEQQILALNNSVSDVKAKDAGIKAQITPMQSQLKTMRDTNNQLKADVNTALSQAKAIEATIKTQEQEKAQLWSTYKENMKSKDYSAAETTFKAIIDKKSSILDNIKQRGTILNQILSSLT